MFFFFIYQDPIVKHLSEVGFLNKIDFYFIYQLTKIQFIVIRGFTFCSCLFVCFFFSLTPTHINFFCSPSSFHKITYHDFYLRHVSQSSNN